MKKSQFIVVDPYACWNDDVSIEYTLGEMNEVVKILNAQERSGVREEDYSNESSSNDLCSPYDFC